MTQGPSYSSDEIHFRLVTHITFLLSIPAFWKGAFSQATLKISSSAPIEEGAGQIQVSILGVYIEEGGGVWGFLRKSAKKGDAGPFFWVFFGFFGFCGFRSFL